MNSDNNEIKRRKLREYWNAISPPSPDSSNGLAANLKWKQRVEEEIRQRNTS